MRPGSDWTRTVVVLRVKASDLMVMKTYTELGKNYIVAGAAAVVGYLVAHGSVPDDMAPVLQAKTTEWALGAAVLIVGFVQSIRASLRAEAARLLPEGASAAEIELKMAALGWRHVLWAVRGDTPDARYDELRAEVLALKAQVVALAARLTVVVLCVLAAACNSMVAPTRAEAPDLPPPVEALATSAAVSVPLTASRWTEGLSPTYVKFKNTATGALYFDVPGPGKAVGYAYGKMPVKVISGAVTARVSITVLSGAPVFLKVPEAGNTCTTPPASVRLFLFANNNDWSGEFSRWWANPDHLELAAGQWTLTTPLVPERWSSVYGKSGAAEPAKFAAALKNVSSLGFTFGGGCFFGHGVYVSGGAARFSILSLMVS